VVKTPRSLAIHESMAVRVAEGGRSLNDRAVGGVNGGYNEGRFLDGPRGGEAKRPEQGGEESSEA